MAGAISAFTGVSGEQAGRQRESGGIVVEHDRGDRGAVLPNHVADFPAVGIRFAREIAVVTDDIAFDLLHAFGDELVGEFGENFFRRAVEFFFEIEREFAVGEIWVAAADEEEVAGERAVFGNCAARFERGVKFVVEAEFGERERGGEQLHVGCGDKIFVVVEREERFAGGGVGDEQAPFAFAGGGIGERDVNARGEAICGGGVAAC